MTASTILILNSVIISIPVFLVLLILSWFVSRGTKNRKTFHNAIIENNKITKEIYKILKK